MDKLIDEKRIKRFIEGAKKAFKEVDDPTFTFPMNILSAYELATSIEELLKAQEPRVMTLTEAFDAEVAWLEMYANPDDGVEPIIQPVIIRYYDNGYWQCLIEQDESADLSLFLDGFGTEFRFWTSRPTDEQRKATPWTS